MRKLLVFPSMLLIALALAHAASAEPDAGKEQKKAPVEPVTSPSKAGEPALGEHTLIFVSRASSPKVYSPVEGAKQTVLAPAYADKYGIRLYSSDLWKERGYVWDTFHAEAVKRADALVDTLKPDYKRDARGVLDYALVEHESLWLTSVLLSKKFLPRFSKEFGDRLHVILIDRRRLFVFPAEGGKLEGHYGAALANLYHDESVVRFPVSLEVFLVDKSGFRVIGAIED